MYVLLVRLFSTFTFRFTSDITARSGSSSPDRPANSATVISVIIRPFHSVETRALEVLAVGGGAWPGRVETGPLLRRGRHVCTPRPHPANSRCLNRQVLARRGSRH